MIIDLISQETGVDVSVLNVIVETASRRYKTYSIPKRNGGLREICHPAPAVKFLQRWVVKNYLSHLPVHVSAMSYRRGVGIAENALVHVKGNYLLKMDFERFFPSIKEEDLRRLILENSASPPFVFLGQADIDALVKIVFRFGELTIGAPSSPVISNAVLFKFDTFVHDECMKRDVRYSRYADDLTFSTDRPNVLADLQEFIRSAIDGHEFPRLKINADKTVFTSRKRKRLVTGLVLTSDKRISVGRVNKRAVKALCYRFTLGALSPAELSYLRGYLSFVRSVEPQFIESLKAKYGAEIIAAIVSAPPVRRK